MWHESITSRDLAPFGESLELLYYEWPLAILLSILSSCSYSAVIVDRDLVALHIGNWVCVLVVMLTEMEQLVPLPIDWAQCQLLFGKASYFFMIIDYPSVRFNS